MDEVDYNDIIDRVDSIATSKAITGLDQNPDDAARALQLSAATGVAPGVIHADLEGFEQQHRAGLAAGIVRNNDQLAAYIRGNQLADVVSNDDYGNLDTFSRSVPRPSPLDSDPFQKFLYNPVKAGLSEAASGAKEAFLEPYREEDLALMKESAPVRYAYHTLDLGHRVMGAVAGAMFGGAKGFAGAEAEAFGADPEKARREVQGILESEMGRAGEHPHADPITAAKPWTDAGIEVPRGVHPAIDTAKAELNSTYLDMLDKNLADAQTSLTRERSPELFQKFAEQHYGDSTIAIAGDRVSELYGDGRVPTPDDGLLGWVPDMESKLEAARLGEDVHVPLADWMTRVDPALAKELHDDLRVWPGGITAREAAEAIEPKISIDSPMAQTRAASGTEPMFSIGDRKLELKRAPDVFDQMHEFQFLDENGKVAGELTIIPDEAKKQLYIANINGMAGLYSNSFGPSLIRDLKRQLKELYPEFETVTGHRVSGARERAGVEMTADNPVVKLSASPEGWGQIDFADEFLAMQRILENAAVQEYGWGISAKVIPTAELAGKEKVVNAVIKYELNRITGKTVDYTGVAKIEREGSPVRIRGVSFAPEGDALPKIIVDLFSSDPVGVARHESIHHLKRGEFFTPEEWEGLISASKAEGWLDRYQINDRYPTLDELKKHEEAIAEAFRDWAQTKNSVQHPDTIVTRAFQKIWDLWEAIRGRLKELFGREITPDELFQKVYSGELAERKGKAGASEPMFSADKVIPFKKRRLTTIQEISNHTSDRIVEQSSKVIELREKAQSMFNEFYRAEQVAREEHQATLKGNDNTSWHDDDWINFLSESGRNAIRSMTRLRNEANELEAYVQAEKLAAGLPEGYRSEIVSVKSHMGGDKWQTLIGGEKEFAVDVINASGESVGQITRGLDGYENSWLSDLLRSGKTESIYDVLTKYPDGEPMFSIEDANAKLDNLRAEAAGLDARSFKKLQALIQERFKEDLAASMKRAEADQKRIQSKEWKEAAKEIRKDVEQTIRNRPDVMADLLIGSGELGGKKLRQRYPLLASDLTGEQRAALPRHYYSKDGLPVDATARMVGFTSGDAMLEKLIEYNKGKEGLTAHEMLEKTIRAEVDRQMSAKFGDLQANIMLDAQDQALSETNLNILAEEWQGAAMTAGVEVVDKNVAKAEALRVFGNLQLRNIDTGRLMTQMLKHARDSERDLIAGNTADALVRMQRRYMLGLMAAEAKKLEKRQKAFAKTAKQFSKREVPSVDAEYTNWIHDILIRVGKPVRRSIQDLEASIDAAEHKTLEEFVAAKQADLREMPVWDQLYDKSWRKNVDDLTVNEFNALHDSIKSIVHNGRDEKKIYKQGEAEDFAAVKQELIGNIADSVHGVVKPPKPSTLAKRYYVGHLQLESIFNRWDAFDSKGAWNQYIMRDLVDGANQVDAWKKEYAAKIKTLGDPEGLTKAIDNPLFKDMDTETMLPFTRKNLIAVMLNTGTKSNLVKLAKGYGLEPTDVMAWVHQHATKKDWDFVQGMWDIFADIKGRADTMYRSLSGGVAPESIEITPVETPFGKLKGGYYPIIFHSEMEGKSKKLMGKDPLEQDGFVRATTPAGYTKSRTGYIAPLALDMDMIPNRISQMLHDIGLRPSVLNAAKVFYDKDVRSAVRKYYGNEYRDQLIPYLQAVANSANTMTKSQAAFTRVSEFIRQNVITTLVGLNPGTVMKHGPSALVTSIREVGPKEFLNATRNLFSVNEATGEKNWQFAIRNSLELQRRDRNWEETIYGSTGVLNPGDKFTPWRQRIMEWSSKPVALSDMASAVPTWLAKYEQEMAKSGIHGDAVYEADRAVRRAHGSTAITNRTTMMRESNPWLTSVYNYFSDIMNRQMETVWRAGETLELAKTDKKAAMKAVGPLTASLFAYALWPAITEYLVSGEGKEPDESWGKVAAKQMAFTLTSSWVGVRDFAAALIHGRDPQFGLTGTAFQEVTNVIRDLGKDHPFAKEHVGRLIQDASAAIGTATGMLPLQVGKVGRFVYDTNHGIEHPRGPWAWMTGLRFGTTKHHSTTFENYRKGLAR